MSNLLHHVTQFCQADGLPVFDGFHNAPPPGAARLARVENRHWPLSRYCDVWLDAAGLAISRLSIAKGEVTWRNFINVLPTHDADADQRREFVTQFGHAARVVRYLDIADIAPDSVEITLSI